jgi:hypothetical protein
LPYTVPPQPYCDFIAQDKIFYPDFAKDSDFPSDVAKDCPYRPVSKGTTISTISFILIIFFDREITHFMVSLSSQTIFR